MENFNKIWISINTDTLQKSKAELLIFTLLVALLLLRLCYIATSATISCKNSHGRYTELGKALLGRKENIYYLKIRQRVMRKAISDTYRIEFPLFFANRHQNEEILILYDKERILARIGKRVILILR